MMTPPNPTIFMTDLLTAWLAAWLACRVVSCHVMLNYEGERGGNGDQSNKLVEQ